MNQRLAASLAVCLLSACAATSVPDAPRDTPVAKTTMAGTLGPIPGPGMRELRFEDVALQGKDWVTHMRGLKVTVRDEPDRNYFTWKFEVESESNTKDEGGFNYTTRLIVTFFDANGNSIQSVGYGFKKACGIRLVDGGAPFPILATQHTITQRIHTATATWEYMKKIDWC